MSLFNSKTSIRRKVMDVINKRIDKAQEELDQEVRALYEKHLEEVRESEERLQTESEFAIEKKVNNILKGII